MKIIKLLIINIGIISLATNMMYSQKIGSVTDVHECVILILKDSKEISLPQKKVRLISVDGNEWIYEMDFDTPSLPEHVDDKSPDFHQVSYTIIVDDSTRMKKLKKLTHYSRYDNGVYGHSRTYREVQIVGEDVITTINKEADFGIPSPDNYKTYKNGKIIIGPFKKN